MALHTKHFTLCFFYLIFQSFLPLYGNDNLKILKIDNKDSVYLKVSEGTISGGFITIPMYIESDDDINSLDFSLNFDDTKIKYESIIDHTGHIQFTDFYNPIDSTLRFTSNSFTLYNLSKKIISVKFKILVNCLSASDFYKMFSYLNGDLCSSKLPNEQVCISSNNDYDTDNEWLKIYPNPTAEVLNILIKEKALATLISPDGATNIFQREVSPNDLISMDIKNYPTGIYLLTIQMEKRKITRKIIIKQ